MGTAAVEMGQGVNTKIIQVAARIFSINMNRIRLESTNTTRVANTSPTAASTGADLNGKAAELACLEAVFYNGEKSDISWNDLIQSAYEKRVNLSAQAHYATPGISYDAARGKGQPFGYHVIGTAITEVTLDCLRGTYEIDSVQAVHDGGIILNPLIDRGQAEGGIVQGIGWLTVEELIYSDDGRLLSGTFSDYKVPDIYYAPEDIKIHFLESSPNPIRFCSAYIRSVV